jgi:hypothetical protein
MNILALPAEVICEISNSIELPADAARFSLACRDFYAYRNIHLLTWVSRMRSIIGEINKIDYTIGCRDAIGFREISHRKRNGITTGNYLYKTFAKLEVVQGFQPVCITRYQEKKYNNMRYSMPNPKSRRANIIYYHDALDRSTKCRTFTLIYDNLIL